MVHNIFLVPRNAFEIRKALLKWASRAPQREYTDLHVANAVVNAADSCPLTCPNCLYSAAVTQKKYNGSPPQLSTEQAERFVQLMNEAKLQQLVFSGGGESFENVNAMEIMLAGITSLEHVVIVTSGYFANTPEETAMVLNRIATAVTDGCEQHHRSKLQVILRLSFDNFHQVATQNIVNIINYARMQLSDNVDFKVVIRTILNVGEDMDVELANMLGASLFPEKNPDNPTDGMPNIDGFPTRWIEKDGWSIPVIYKPIYFEGMGANLGKKVNTIPGTHWSDIKAAEEVGDKFFNLSLRGSRGEGHNFYGTILKGYSYWKVVLGSEMHCLTPSLQSEKGYSVYLPANGRLFINASSPDSWLPILKVSNWEEYLGIILSDILQYMATSVPTNVLMEIAKEVEPDIISQIDKRNFVFAIPFLCMKDEKLRLYLTIRFLQIQESQGKIVSLDPFARSYIDINVIALQEDYRDAKEETGEVNRFADPIVGDSKSIHGGWYDD